MPDIAAIIQHGAGNPWLYLPFAVLIGALHALEPGHSKSLMAAFIVAIRGTAGQAVLLGVSAAIGHTIVVFGLALLGLWLGDKLILDRAEPWLVLISGLLIIGLAARLMWAVHRGNSRRAHHDHHDHDHHDSHDHDHDHDHHHDHGHVHPAAESATTEELDAHAAMHAREIKERFASRASVGNGEIIWFGFTGGLLPCPAAIAVLLICLQLKAFALGVGMVAAFSIGLAITLVSVGVITAWGASKASSSWSGFERWSGRLPYISGGLVMAMGLFITIRGLMQLGFFG